MTDCRVFYYSVYDAVAMEYGPMFPAVNDGVAMRMFKTLLKDVNPDDLENYRLCHICDFDSSLGEISNVHLDIVCDGSYFVKKVVSK